MIKKTVFLVKQDKTSTNNKKTKALRKTEIFREIQNKNLWGKNQKKNIEKKVRRFLGKNENSAESRTKYQAILEPSTTQILFGGLFVLCGWIMKIGILIQISKSIIYFSPLKHHKFNFNI